MAIYPAGLRCRRLARGDGNGQLPALLRRASRGFAPAAASFANMPTEMAN